MSQVKPNTLEFILMFLRQAGDIKEEEQSYSARSQNNVSDEGYIFSCNK